MRMYFNRKVYCILLLSSLSIVLDSQIIKSPDFFIEGGAVLTTGNQTPFWLMSNQYGLLTSGKENEWIRVGLKATICDQNKIGLDYGLDLIGRHSLSNQLYIHQAYTRLKLHFLNIQIGIIEEKFGNQDSTLSSGGLLWSGNARPIPKISILVQNYTPVPFTHGYLEFKGGISHGWFGNNQFMKNSLLHHKYLYLQLGGRLPVHLSYGYHHFAQWGGESVDPGIGKMPDTFNDFIKVFFAQKGGDNASISDLYNALGNHLGSRNLGLDVNLSKVKLGIYWQTIFEDSSGMKYRNIKDGLFGIYIHSRDKNHLLNGFVYEYINTKDQSGESINYYFLNGIYYSYPVPGSLQITSGGNDNYFNHGTYQAGWTYNDMVIGTPLITSPAIFMGAHPGANHIMNNRMTGHHFGLEGKYKDLEYKVFFTYYLNYGTMSYPFETTLPQYSLLLQSRFNNLLPWGIKLTLAVGIDHGEFYGNNTGLRISMSKTSNFNNFN